MSLKDKENEIGLPRKVEQERINNFRQKQAKQNTSFRFKNDESRDRAITFEALNENPQEELMAATMCSAMGSGSTAVSQQLLTQTLNASFYKENDPAKAANTITDFLLSFEPKDEIEAMLCSRLVVLHDHYMRCMAAATHPENSERILDSNINRATKLMRLYNETLHTFNKYRRKADQKVVVQHQHINVNEGGQMAVGNFQTGGGDSSKMKGAPHATQE